jgi:hypothetical protein
MNNILWLFQILLALHTAVGAVWKFSNSEQMVPSLSAIPHGLWLAMSVIELAFSVDLVLPALIPRLGLLVPIAAGAIAVEMLAFCAVNLQSVEPNQGQLLYWIVVAGFCGFIVYGRLVLAPFKPKAAP